MTIGVAFPAGVDPTGNAVDTYLDWAAEAAQLGLTAVWCTQRGDADALSLAAVIGSHVPGIAIGTSVVPIYPRHPLVVANQANVAQAATHGRFTLGLGLGAPVMTEPTFGVDASRPIRHLREYLTALNEVFDRGTVDFAGETLVARTRRPATLAGADKPSILVAALGPQSLQVTGELADGTLPNLVGPRTLETFLIPRITAAAEQAGRNAPRIVVALTAIVTDDVEQVSAHLTEQMAIYGQIPSYRAALDREGVGHPVELAVIGDEAVLAAAIARYRDAGATEIVLVHSAAGGEESRRRTWAAAAALV